MPGGKVVLVDGNSLAYRAFFALPPLTTADGQPTSAVYGFLTMLFRFLAEEKPEFLAVAFDRGRPQARLERFPEYKAGRAPAPPELKSQIPLLKEVLSALEVAVFEAEGWEADDVLGTMARQAREAGLEVVVLTGDRDTLQLIDPQTRVVVTRKGITETVCFDMAALEREYGLKPAQMADLKGLMGDSSDNIPGVPGVGEKTALRLLRDFGSLDELLRRVNEVPGKLGEKLEECADQARLSRELATIDVHAPVSFDPDACRRRVPDRSRVEPLFRRLEFRRLLAQVPGLGPPAPAGRPGDRGMAQGPGQASAPDAAGHGPAALPDQPGLFPEAAAPLPRLELEPLRDLAGFSALEAEAAASGSLAVVLALEGPTPRRARLAGLGLSARPGRSYFWSPDLGPAGEALAGLVRLWQGTGRVRVGHELKPALAFMRCAGCDPAEPGFDTAIAAYLLDPSRTSYHLEDLAQAHLGQAVPAAAGATAQALAIRAEAALRLVAPLTDEMETRGLLPLFREVEMPLVRVLADMEVEGVGVDRVQLEALSQVMGRHLEAITREIYGLAGVEFNVNSPRQLADVLFNKLGLPVQKRTKTGYSTDAEVLEALAPQHPVVAKILEHRQLAKLRGTYVEGLREQIDPATGRVHSTFNQTVTTTGRISSSEPNLQNLPVRMEMGRRLRSVIVPTGKGRVLLSADYSQIELRVLAHLSGDEGLIESFRRSEDIHTRTAAEVFGVKPEEVTPLMRFRAKAVNFGIIYGMSDFGLAREIGVGKREAAAYIERYFSRYPRVKEYLTRTVEEARQRGYVTTLLNRRRYLPELHSRIQAQRGFAERTAMNTPIQGSAADIIKVAMVAAHRRLASKGLSSRLILQVHDELVFEGPEAEVPALAPLVREAMEGAHPLAVPLVVEVKVGPNWYDMRAV
ncbi:MAG: DNA polymerase I [Acetobacteraceae bacterium]|nr:DNA polymerase I [Acetobacteraceae bacterium]